MRSYKKITIDKKPAKKMNHGRQASTNSVERVYDNEQLAEASREYWSDVDLAITMDG
ncbi:MAG: hypothetical protein ACKVRP_02895 [Bacteroidota bacterium]